MNIEELRNELALIRKSRVRIIIPESIWKEICKLAQIEGVNVVAKDLKVNSTRLRSWAKIFEIKLPPAKIQNLKKKSKSNMNPGFIKVAPVNIQNNKEEKIDYEAKKILELVTINGSSLSLFEPINEKQLKLLFELSGALK